MGLPRSALTVQRDSIAVRRAGIHLPSGRWRFRKGRRRRQPFNENLLMPCMLIDNPHHSREIVALSGAQPTHPGADAYFNELRDELDDYASEVERVYEPIWSCMDGNRRPPH